ncbi:MAG: SIS domain-containing protein [Ruminococcus sp.]|nr:SIS domain-containing protein [Candidatus Apopatosoma intestinale]
MINLEKEIREQPTVLSGLKNANEKVLRNLSDEMKHRRIRHVYFAARGTSDHAATYAQYLFGFVAGLPCGLATPSVISRYGGKIDYRDSLVIGLSQSGEAADVIAVISEAKEMGALTAAVTNSPDSPLAGAVDYHLYCSAGKETSIAATKTFTAQMMLLAYLCAEYTDHEPLKKALGDVPSQIAHLLDYMPEELAQLTKRYVSLESAVVLGRGFAYPIALEGALKILETNNVKMRGYAASDFHHGPKAQLSAGDLAIVLDLKGPVCEDAEALIEELKSMNADVIVITDTAHYDADPTLTVLKIPGLAGEGVPSDALNVYAAAVVLQLFALELTVAKGIDPDASAVLKKVTITK